MFRSAPIRSRLPLPACALVAAVLAAPLLTGAPAALAADAWPSQPVRLVVPFPPAGGTDVLSRLVFNKVGAATHWTVVVENRAGAGGNIGLDTVAKARADGYTVGMGQTANLAINPSLYPKMPYDAVRDFTPVVLVSAQPVVVIVRQDAPFKTLADLVAAGKAKQLSMASAGTGTVGHLTGEMFQRRAGIKALHVPYKGASPALTDLMGGQTDFYFATPPIALPMLKAGKLRALAVTSAKRSPFLPDIPTIAESGVPVFDVSSWYALFLPPKTPAEIVGKVYIDAVAAIVHPPTKQRFADIGTIAGSSTPAQLTALLKSELDKWGPVIKELGIKPD